MQRVWVLLASVVALGGCGSDEERAAQPSASASELKLTFRADEGAAPRTVSFRCPGPDCGRLGRIDSQALAGTPPDVACTELYGGPQVARLTGTLEGRRVDARFSRTDGCEIHRWDEVVGVLAPDLAVGAPPAP